MKVRIIPLAATLTAGAVHAASPGKLGAVSESKVTFAAIGPAGLKINGSGSGVRAAEKDGKVTLTVSTGTFETGIALRDKHLRRYLESEKHPTAEMIIDESKITLPEGSAPASGKVTVPLTLHGKTVPTNVSYEIRRQGSGYVVQGDFDVSIQKFDIEKPCYLGVCVADGVRVAAKFVISAS